MHIMLKKKRVKRCKPECCQVGISMLLTYSLEKNMSGFTKSESNFSFN